MLKKYPALEYEIKIKLYFLQKVNHLKSNNNKK